MGREDLSRIAAFSDGVIAVAITLLVLNIEVPDVPGSELGDALVDLIPSLGAYVLAFALVGRYWVIHHQLFFTFARFDGRLLGLNLLFLMLIALVPFATNLVDAYSSEPLAAGVFAATLGLAAAVHWVMTEHAFRAGLVKKERYEEEERTFGHVFSLAICALFFLSVPVAFLSMPLAWLMWAAPIVFRYPLRRAVRWLAR